MELAHREVIAHDDGKEEVRRHREQRTADSRPHGSWKDIHDVLQTGKTHRDEHSIDDTVDILIELRTTPDEDVKEQPLEEFLRYTRLKETDFHTLRQSNRLARRSEGRHHYHNADGAEHAVAEGLEKLFRRFRRFLVLHINIEQEIQDRRYGSKELN